MRDSERHETQYGYYTIGEYDARQETDDLGRKSDEYGNSLKDRLQEGIFNYISSLWHSHPASLIGAFAGVFLALCILIFGFFPVMFVVICGAAGLFIGINIDREGNWLYNIQRSLPSDWHRWK